MGNLLKIGEEKAKIGTPKEAGPRFIAENILYLSFSF